MTGLILLLFLALLFWLLLVRPQRARAREQQELIRSLEPGDEIVSTGGIYGTIVSVDGDVLHVEIAEGLRVRMARRAVAGYVEPPDEEADDEPEEADEQADEADEPEERAPLEPAEEEAEERRE
jgi:preprotein translocase subunit YajC